MEVRFGVQHANRDVVVNSDSTPEKLAATIAKAHAAGELLSLMDVRGRTVLIPTEKLAFVEIGPAAERRVGFAAEESA